MLYAIVPALLRYVIHTPCFSAFWHSHPYIFMHFLEMFFYSCCTSDGVIVLISDSLIITVCTPPPQDRATNGINS